MVADTLQTNIFINFSLIDVLQEKINTLGSAVIGK